MIPFHDLLFFAIAGLVLVISPGPSMVYIISRTIAQGQTAGMTSLTGVICGFLFHTFMVSFGLTAILLAIPFVYTVLKISGVIYLFYLAFQAVQTNSKNIFITNSNLKFDKHGKLIYNGFLITVLNPKVAVFYLSLFPQFIKQEYGSIMAQSLQLGMTQVFISFIVNFMIVLTSAKAAVFFAGKTTWIKIQKWFMASALTVMAIKMAYSKAK